MKCLFLSTSTLETNKYAESFRDGVPGSVVDFYRYDEDGYSDAKAYAATKEFAPDVIVYVGSRWGRQISTSTLAHITGRIAPMIHLCSDAADPPWHDLLREYDSKGAFALQVAIDGNDQWPGASSGLTLLTPIAASHFPAEPKPHVERTIACGYAGNPGNPMGRRRTILFELMSRNVLTLRMRVDSPGSYDQMCAFLSDARMSLNIPFSGTETTTQVKGRVIETGLAGGFLMEGKGAPTRKWFSPGVDFFEYDDIGAALLMIEHYSKCPDITEQIGANLRRRVLAEHSPAIFWGKVLDRIGMKAAA